MRNADSSWRRRHAGGFSGLQRSAGAPARRQRHRICRSSEFYWDEDWLPMARKTPASEDACYSDNQHQVWIIIASSVAYACAKLSINLGFASTYRYAAY